MPPKPCAMTTQGRPRSPANASPSPVRCQAAQVSPWLGKRRRPSAASGSCWASARQDAAGELRRHSLLRRARRPAGISRVQMSCSYVYHSICIVCRGRSVKCPGVDLLVAADRLLHLARRRAGRSRRRRSARPASTAARRTGRGSGSSGRSRSKARSSMPGLEDPLVEREAVLRRREELRVEEGEGDLVAGRVDDRVDLARRVPSSKTDAVALELARRSAWRPRRPSRAAAAARWRRSGAPRGSCGWGGGGRSPPSGPEASRGRMRAIRRWSFSGRRGLTFDQRVRSGGPGSTWASPRRRCGWRGRPSRRRPCGRAPRRCRRRCCRSRRPARACRQSRAGRRGRCSGGSGSSRRRSCPGSRGSAGPSGGRCRRRGSRTPRSTRRRA